MELYTWSFYILLIGFLAGVGFTYVIKLLIWSIKGIVKNIKERPNDKKTKQNKE